MGYYWASLAFICQLDEMPHLCHWITLTISIEVKQLRNIFMSQLTCTDDYSNTRLWPLNSEQDHFGACQFIYHQKETSSATDGTRLKILDISDFEDGSSCWAGASGEAPRRGSLLPSLPRHHLPSWCELPFKNSRQKHRYKLSILKISTAVKLKLFSCRPVFGHTTRHNIWNIILQKSWKSDAGWHEEVWAAPPAGARSLSQQV